MSLIQRKARPLKRDADGYRDDRLFIIACDDTYAPKQYFDFFKLPRVKVFVAPTEHGKCGAESVLDRLLQFEFQEDDERWLLLDTDHYTRETHIRSFLSALKRATRQGVRVALSKPCFELWLLLHHVEASETFDLQNATAVDERLRTILGSYNKTRLRSEDFTIDKVVEACKRAHTLDQSVVGEIPAMNTSRIYLLWQSIIAGALPSQLHPQLAQLARDFSDLS